MKRQFILLLLFVLFSLLMGETNFTHTTSADFNEGCLNNVLVTNNSIGLPGQATGLSSWVSTTDLPMNLRDHKICYWNNFIYLVGGYDGNSYSDNVYCASASTIIGSWTQLTSLPQAVRDHEVLVANGYLYVLGGRQDGNPFSEIYYTKINNDGSICNWQTSTTTLPTGLWGFTAEYIAGFIYIVGGSDQSSETSAVNTVYSAKVSPLGELGNFIATSSLPDNRNQHTMVVYADHLYVLGGFDNAGINTNTMYYSQIGFDGTCSSWIAANTLPVSISGHSSTCNNGLISIIGGNNGSISNSTYFAEIDNTNSFSWNTGPHYTNFLTDSEAVGINDRIFVVGGYNDIEKGYLNDCYYSNLTLSTDKITDGIFVSKIFEFGTDKTINELDYTLTNFSALEYNVFYRTASNNENWGSWQDKNTDNPIEIGESKKYIQYMFWFHTENVLSNITLEDVTVKINGFTEVSGTISGTLTWSLANSPYWVTSDLTLSSGTLTIEPGVEIIFSSEAGFQISAAELYCVGTVTDSILFTSYNGEIGTWDGIYFDANSDNGVSSTMDYTIIEKAGSGSRNANLYCNGTIAPNAANSSFRLCSGRGVYLTSSDIPFVNCNFEYNFTEGIYINSGNPTFINCSSRNNDYGIHFPDINVDIPTGLDISSNTIGAVALEGGTITSDKVWPFFDGDYVVLSSINVDLNGSKCRLTIEPGNTIKFDEGVQLTIGDNYNNGGELYAIGTPDSLITFTSANGNPGGWNGIYFHIASDYLGATNLMKHCVIENGNNSNIYLNDAQTVTIDSCIIKNSADIGLEIVNSNVSISNTEFCDNIGYPIHANSAAYINDFSNINIHSNIENVIAMETSVISNDRIWRYTNGDYLLLGNLSVDAPSTTCRLTIEPGNTIKFNDGVQLTIGDNYNDGGELYAEGTVDSLITFTSASGNPGDWNGVYFHIASDYAGSTSHLQHCVIENGNERNIYLNDANSVVIEDCLIQNSLGYGIVNNNSQLAIANSEITGNANYPIYYNNPYYIKELNNLNIHDNILDYVASEAGTISTDRRWKYCNVPYLILGNLTIEKSNSTCCLTIDPGCTVKFDNGLLLMADTNDDCGELHAVGKADSLITFTAANDSIGGWKGIQFNPGSDYYSVISQLQYSVIEKGDLFNIYFNAANNHIVDNCLIQYSAENGINVTSSDVNLSNIQVENNNGYGLIYNNFNLMENDVSTFQFADNGKNFIGLGGNVSSGDVYLPYWFYGYSVLGDITMETTNGVGAKLTIAPGNTLRFDNDCTLKVGDDSNDGGELYAVGTPDSIITFTSLNDSIGGWTGIYFADGSNSSTCSSNLTYCNIENGEDYNIYCYNTDEPTMDHITSSNSLLCGLRLNNSSPTATISRFVNNEQYGVYLQGSSNPNIGNDPALTCDLYGNTLYDVYNETTQNIDFLYNYWNSTDSGFVSSRIYDNFDDPTKGLINFMPLSTTSLFGNYPPEQFSLLTPSNNAIVNSEHPYFTWEEATDPEAYSTNYEFWYTSDSTWTSYNKSPLISDTFYTIPETLSGINHFWWQVVAYDQNLATYSLETRKFTISLQPSIPSPILPWTEDYMTSEDYLVWINATDPDEGDAVSYYHIQIDEDNNFNSPEVDMTQIGLVRNTPLTERYKSNIDKNSSQKLINENTRDYAYAITIDDLTGYANLQDNTNYFWRVSAIDEYGIEGDYSTGTDQFIYFANGLEMRVVENITIATSGTSININWQAVTQDVSGNPVTVSRYNIYRSDNVDFSPTISDYIGTTTNTMFVDNDVLLDDVNYYYVITAVVGLNHFRDQLKLDKK